MLALLLAPGTYPNCWKVKPTLRAAGCQAQHAPRSTPATSLGKSTLLMHVEALGYRSTLRDGSQHAWGLSGPNMSVAPPCTHSYEPLGLSVFSEPHWRVNGFLQKTGCCLHLGPLQEITRWVVGIHQASILGTIGSEQHRQPSQVCTAAPPMPAPQH